ncbi:MULTISPECIES: hypothetical protein [Moorena]|nr:MULTISPECIES: hypothetical protein [Moorena]NEQ13459.1 hypothetical protein [Moorena sp. SIO3E2]
MLDLLAVDVGHYATVAFSHSSSHTSHTSHTSPSLLPIADCRLPIPFL